MSLLGFQRALADLAASPELCSRAISHPAPAFLPYDLTSREESRLAAMVRDRLMGTNCVLYRVNRVTPIYVFFPMTCQVLGGDLRRELDAFWSVHRATDLQYLPETSRFVRFLKNRLHAGALRNEFVEEIVDYEAAATELRFAKRTDSLVRHIRFSHDPAQLLDLLSKSNDFPPSLPRGEYWVTLVAKGEELEVRVTQAESGSRHNLRCIHGQKE